MSTLASPTPPASASASHPVLTPWHGAGLAPGSGWHARRYIKVFVNLALLGLITVSFGSGWVASLLGLTEFGLHKYSSIALFVVALTHLILHWRGLTFQLQHLASGQPDRRDARQPDRRSGVHERRDPERPDGRAPGQPERRNPAQSDRRVSQQPDRRS